MRALRHALIVLCLLSGCTTIHPVAPNLPSRSSIAAGQAITVDGNPNIYAVAQKYNVSMRELIVLNNLQPPFTLKPGQSLILPSGASNISVNGPVMPSPSAAPSSAIEQVPLAPIETAPLPPPKKDQQQGGILPAPVTASVIAQAPPPPVATTAAPATIAPAAAAVSPASPQAAVAPASPPEPPTPPSATHMVWPVQGPVVSSFGPKGQGLNNDGINIGAPKGAPVVAAGNGIVVYAGNEMKGFGNLVLIRHKDGWVTAYAHLDRTLVNKDAVVVQGDMIGTVGKTGNVPTPQLHFETRYQGKPVDPAGVIKAQ